MFKKKKKDNNDVNKKAQVITKEERMHLTDDDATVKVKLWWSENGKSIIVGVVLGIVGIVGYNVWTSRQDTQAREAATLFEQVIIAYESNDSDGLNQLNEQLVNKYASTDYAAQSQMLFALSNLQSENRDIDLAINAFQDALDKAVNPATEHTARLNLAKAQIEKEDFDSALTTLSIENPAGFETKYNELKADIYVFKGENDQAKELYETVLNSLDPGNAYREIIEIKLYRL